MTADASLPPAEGRYPGVLRRTDGVFGAMADASAAAASLPPADVQRPTPPLTDEELAGLWELTEQGESLDCIDSARLIADLLASLAEVERLREAVSDLKLNGGA